MADSKTVQEPSMEEILSSIRRIIAEDDGAGAGPSAADVAESGSPAASTAALPPDDDDDVLELTEVVGGPGQAPEAAITMPAPPTNGAAAPPRPEPIHATQENPPMPAPALDALISPVAASASTQALARLAKAAGSDEKKPAITAGVTVEQLLVDLLTPMLRDWLDKNLPEIVERVVEQEVKKLARRAELM